MKQFFVSLSAATVGVLAMPAQAQEFTVTNELDEAQYVAACVQKLPAEAAALCTEQFARLPDYHRNAEDEFYEILLNLDSNSKKLDRGELAFSRSDYRNAAHDPGSVSLATPRGKTLNLEKLEGLTFSVRLAGADFESFDWRREGIFGKRLHRTVRTGLHYQYVIAQDGEELARGSTAVRPFELHSQWCDEESQVKKCRKRLTPQYGGTTEGEWYAVNPRDTGYALPFRMLIDKAAPFYKRVDMATYSYDSGRSAYVGTRATEAHLTPKGPAVKGDLTIGDVSGGEGRTSAKVQFTYAKMAMFEDVVVEAPVRTASPAPADANSYTARANTDQEYRYALESCTAQYRAENNRNKRGLGSAVGIIGGLFGGSAREISKVAGASQLAGDVLNTLTADQKASVDRCLADRGFTQ